MKILVIRLSSLGDIVLTQPVIAWLVDKYPEAELHFLTKQQFSAIPEHFIRPSDSENTQMYSILIYQKTLAFHQSLKDTRYDIVIDLQAKFSTWLIKLFTTSARQYTYKKQHLLRRAIIAHKTDQKISSTLDLYFSALDELAKTHLEVKQTHYPRLYPRQGDNQFTDGILEPFKRNRIIALFPGATHSTKRYPSELFIRFIEQLPGNFRILLLGSKNEWQLCERIHLALPQKTLNLAGEATLSQLIYLIDKADVTVSNDSGPMHIAAALSKPQVALFGSTHPKLGFAPLNEKAKVICKNLPCQPCSLHGLEACPLKHFACMISIKPEEIVSALDKLGIA